MSSLLIATPCYGKQVGEGYLRSIMASFDLVRSKGHTINLTTLGNESLITRARNNQVAHFLASNYDRLMFIDSDISWSPQVLLRLLESEYEVCGIPYPTKTRDWDKVSKYVRGKVESQEEIKIPELINSSLRYTINIAEGSSTSSEDGWIEVEALGTGFLMMKRNVIEKLKKIYWDELHYVNDVSGYDKYAPAEHCVGLFETMIDPKSRRYLSEDYAFCKRWRDNGGKIFAYTKAKLVHSGNTDF